MCVENDNNDERLRRSSCPTQDGAGWIICVFYNIVGKEKTTSAIAVTGFFKKYIFRKNQWECMYWLGKYKGFENVLIMYS